MIRKLLKISSSRMADKFRANLTFFNLDEVEEVYYNQWSFYDNSESYSEKSLVAILNRLSINSYQITIED